MKILHWHLSIKLLKISESLGVISLTYITRFIIMTHLAQNMSCSYLVQAEFRYARGACKRHSPAITFLLLLFCGIPM